MRREDEGGGVRGEDEGEGGRGKDEMIIYFPYNIIKILLLNSTFYYNNMFVF